MPSRGRAPECHAPVNYSRHATCVARQREDTMTTTNTLSPTVSHERQARTDSARYLVPLGRLLLSLIFLQTILGHFSRATFGYAAQQGVPMPEILVPLSGIIAIVGGLSVTFGYRTRVGAALLIAFLIPVTLFMHQFWNVPDAMTAQLQRVMFLKNVSILGGLLLLAYFGAGPISVDERPRTAVSRH
jgi:putative oxidoreductase